MLKKYYFEASLQKKSLKNLVRMDKSYIFASVLKTASRGGAVVARWAHNPKAGGSIPSPATLRELKWVLFFYLCFFKQKMLKHTFLDSICLI